jgi:hypothetical protein
VQEDAGEEEEEEKKRPAIEVSPNQDQNKRSGTNQAL